MKPEIIGLMALGALNIILGVLVALVFMRISDLHKLILDVESRISRLEILTSLADSSPEQKSKRQA